MSWSRALTLFGCMTLLSACNSDKAPFSYSGTPNGGGVDLGGDDTDTVIKDTADTADTADSADPDDTAAYKVPEGELDDPGDYSGGTPTDEGIVEIDLSDISGDSNEDQEFYLILVNTGSQELSYELNFIPTDTEEDTAARRPPPPALVAKTPTRPAELSKFRQQLKKSITSGQTNTYQPPVGPPPPLSSGDIGVAQDDFRVRNELEDDTSIEYITATLWAVSESVAIWVDNDQPIDWDYDCDGNIDEYDANGNAYGFDNCDLQTIADVVDINIIPNLTGYFGDVSDVDNNGLVSIVITPILNQLPLDSEDEDIQSSFIGSYADPEVDLNERSKSNENSNEQEVIFAFAPDPYGFYNIYTQTTIEEYTDVSILAQISQSLYRLISYNQHVLVFEGEVEDAWVREGMSMLAVDLAGFGSVSHNDAWDYLDATHLRSLTGVDNEGTFPTLSYGGQYLFFRWLVDMAGTDALAGLVQTSEIGVDNIEAGIADYVESKKKAKGSSSVDMDELVLMWQVALLTTGILDDDGDVMVDESSYAPYADAEIISAPITNPTSGDLYGANGYQTGINIRGENIYVEGGTTAEPEVNESRQVRLSNTDYFNHIFGQDFFGYISESYAVQVVRLANMPYDEGTLEIRASSADYLPLVLRWNDPVTEDYTVEVSPSPTDINFLSLPALPQDGSPIYAVGDLSDVGYTASVDEDGAETVEKVYDTDLWYLDLSDRAGAEEVRVAVWMDRRYGEEEGEVDLDDPWLAVVPSFYVPIPSVSTTNSDSCPSGYSFAYPSAVLEHLYYQLFPSSTSFDDAGNDEDTGDLDTSSVLGDFDPCGEVSEETTSCEEDWDRDGVLDSDEPKPTTFLEQLQTMQCTLLGGDLTGITPADSNIFDDDERDSDDAPSYNRQLNLGGTSAEEGEGAYVEASLTGGGTYIIAVGAGDSTGAYELTFKQIID